MKRKQSTVILSAAMAAMMLMSGCGKDGGSAQQETATKNADGKYEPTLTITIAKQLDENTGRYGDGEDINNNPMTRLTEEKLGLKMETTLLGGDASNYDTKLRLALTGSEKLPDIFPVYGTQMISDMIESGQVKAIDDDIEKYMPDRLKEIYDKYPETFYPVTKDGKTYGIACTPCMDAEEIMVIRQDWLDNLGLQAPTNLDEFEAVIKAFQKTTQMETAKMIRMDSPIPEMIFTIPDGFLIRSTCSLRIPGNSFRAYGRKMKMEICSMAPSTRKIKKH